MLVVTNIDFPLSYPKCVDPWYQGGVHGTRKRVFQFDHVPFCKSPSYNIYINIQTSALEQPSYVIDSIILELRT